MSSHKWTALNFIHMSNSEWTQQVMYPYVFKNDNIKEVMSLSESEVGEVRWWRDGLEMMKDVSRLILAPALTSYGVWETSLCLPHKIWKTLRSVGIIPVYKVLRKLACG